MTTPELPPAVEGPSVWREIVGGMLLVGGIAGLVSVAFLLHPLAGAAALSVLLVAVGVMLTTAEV